MNSITPTLPSLAAAGVRYAPEISAAAARHGLDPTLLAAVAAQETGGPDTNAGHNIVGDFGHGHGVFQIDDRWHDFASTADAMVPAKNAEYAATMISGLIKKYGGDVHAALSAYNAGSPHARGTTTTWGDGTTLGYADSVLRHQTRIQGTAWRASSTPGRVPAPLVERCRAEHQDTYESIDALRSLMSGVQGSQCDAEPSAPHQQPPARSWRDIAGLSGSGGAREGQSSFLSGYIFTDAGH